VVARHQHHDTLGNFESTAKLRLVSGVRYEGLLAARIVHRAPVALWHALHDSAIDQFEHRARCPPEPSAMMLWTTRARIKLRVFAGV
jgi:hypothetical protein